MPVHAVYMVKCTGGGWLVPGRPLICHRVAVKFPSERHAHRAALKSGWTESHTCPQHQNQTEAKITPEVAADLEDQRLLRKYDSN